MAVRIMYTNMRGVYTLIQKICTTHIPNLMVLSTPVIFLKYITSRLSTALNAVRQEKGRLIYIEWKHMSAELKMGQYALLVNS